jgi:hypothetical protein
MDSYGESDFWVESMACSSTGKIPTRTILRWHDRKTIQSRPAYASDIALLSKQGGQPILQEFDYSNFVCSETLATTIAAREQQEVSAMPRVFVLRALRTMAHLKETDPFILVYPELNIASVVVRVVSISRGNLDAGEIVLNCVEDVFGTFAAAYASPPAAGTGPAAEGLEEVILDSDYSEITFETDSTEYGPYSPEVECAENLDLSDEVIGLIT